MANIIIKSRERREAEARVARIFTSGGGSEGNAMRDAARREYVECVTARTKEATDALKKSEERR